LNTALIATIGYPELLLILLIVLLLFGGSKIPQLARSLGKGVNEFKAGMKEGDAKVPAADENKSDKPKAD
jgi:sec-independent protein translocase protein TatA